MSIHADSAGFEPGSILKFVTLDASAIHPLAGVLRFHGHNTRESIIWQGITYAPWPIELSGFEKTSERPPTPTLVAANHEQVLTAMCLQFDDLVGATVTVKSTLLKYLDSINFVGPELLLNPDLDTDFDGWSRVAGGTVSSNGGWTTLNSATIYQTIDTEAGSEYRVKVDTDGRTAGVRVGDSTSTQQYLNTTLTGLSKEAVFVGTGSKVVVRIYKGAGNGDVRIRNVSVRKIIGNPTADPTQEFPDEVWYIDRKDHEDFKTVKWSLASALDFNGIRLPARVIVANQCAWMYRSAECSYAGPAVAKSDDTPTDSMTLDSCSRKVSGCKLRFGENEPLPYGSFPAAGLMR